MTPINKNHRSQQGVASIEFALSFMLLLLIILGLSSLGALVWAQQKLSFAAGEGARALFQEYNENRQQHIKDGSCHLLLNNAQAKEQAIKASGFLAPHSTSEIILGSCTPQAAPLSMCNYSVRINYDTTSNTLIHLLARFQSSTSDNAINTPNTLSAKSTVQLLCRL